MELNSLTSHGHNNLSKKQNIKRHVKASTDAACAVAAASGAEISAKILILGGINKIAAELNNKEKRIINCCCDKFLEDENLISKGVRIDNVNKKVANTKNLPGFLFTVLNPYAAISEGKNAAFIIDDLHDYEGKLLHKKNTILVNRKKLHNAIFHEIGHSINTIKSKPFKIMQNLRGPCDYLSKGILLYSVLSSKSEEKEGKELNIFQKTNNFIRKNAGIIGFCSMLPAFAEETAASVRGTKYAQKNLRGGLAKKIAKTNMLSISAYFIGAAGCAAAATFGVKIKDKALSSPVKKD